MHIFASGLNNISPSFFTDAAPRSDGRQCFSTVGSQQEWDAEGKTAQWPSPLWPSQPCQLMLSKYRQPQGLLLLPPTNRAE